MRHTTSFKFFMFLLLLSMLNGSVFADSPDHQPPDDDEEEEECGKCEQDKSDCKEKTCGDPFYLHNGEFFWEKTFLDQPESPLNLAFRLRYSTLSDYNGFVGARWTPNYNMRVYETDAGNLIVRKNDGTRTEFRDGNSDNVFESQNIRNQTLTILGDGTYQMVTRSQMSYFFDTDGKLTSIADTQGNELRISYASADKYPVYGLPVSTNLEIAGATNLSNRQTVPVPIVRDYRISRVDEYLDGAATGRFLEYVYDATSGRLIQVHDQSWDDQAQTGLRVQLSYDVDGRGDLEQITDPIGSQYDFTYYSAANLKFQRYYRFMESFEGEGCSDCSKRWLTYSVSNGVARVSRQVQGPDKNNPIGEIVDVTNYSTSYTDVRYTLKDFDVNGVQIGSDRYRYERVYFITDEYGENRVDRRYISEDTSYTVDDLEAQFIVYNSNSSSPDYHGVGKEYLIGRIKTEILKNGSQIEYDYDINGNRIREAQWVDASGTRLRVKEIQYDVNNNRTRETIFYEEAGSPVGSSFITVYEYDGFNRLTAMRQVKNPEELEASWQYISVSYTYVGSSGRRLTKTWPNGKVTEYEYSDTDSDPANDTTSIFLVTRKFDPANPADEERYTYDSNGFRDSMTNALGQTWTSINDNLGRVLTEMDPLGYQTIQTYTPDNANIASIEAGIKTGEVSRKTVYSYDALSRRNLISRVDANDLEIPKQKQSYDNEGRVIQMQAVVTVDGTGTPTQEVVMGQNSYNVFGWLESVTTPHPDGNVTVTYEYDVAGRQTAMVQPTETGSVRIENVYDGLDRLVTRTEAVGSTLQRAMTYEYDVLGNMTQITYSGDYDDISGTYQQELITRYYYDSIGRKVGTNWDPANPTPDADGARELPMLMTYDDMGNLLSKTDGEGNTTLYSYDDDNRLTRINWDDVADAPLANYAGRLPQKMVYDLLGNLLSQTDGEGNTTYYYYDVINRQTHVSVPQAAGQTLTGNWWETPANVINESTYNAFGQKLKEKSILAGSYALNSNTLATVQPETSTVYDRLGRMESSTNLDGLTLTYTYNNIDQVLAITYPEVNLGDGPTSSTNTYNSTNPKFLDSTTDRAGNASSFTYTIRGQRKTVTTSLGAVTTYSYDDLGRLVSESTDMDLDGTDDTAVYTFDQFNQLRTITFPDHVATTNERIQTRTYTQYGQLDTQTGTETYDIDYNYDLAGNRTQMITQYGSAGTDATTTWYYNSRNQLERKEYADSTDYDYTYNDAGNLLTRTDALQQQTKYYYNTYNLLEIIDYPNDDDVRYEFDALERRTAMYEGGSTDAFGVYTGGSLTEEWDYYTNNRVRLNKQHVSGYQLSYTYSGEGQRVTRTVDKITGGDAWTLTYGYDASNRMASILDPQVSATAFGYTYKPNSNLVANRTNPNGSGVSQIHDIYGRVTSIATQNGSSVNLDSHAYTYDKAGLRKNQTLLDSTVRDYQYDERRQLIKADDGSASFDFAYQYDATGNRLRYAIDGDLSDAASTDTTYTPNNLNQYTSFTPPSLSPTTPTYDVNGSLTVLELNTYVWDDENRLEEVTNGTRRTVSTYDGSNRRIKRQEYTGGTLNDTIYYVYDGDLPVLEIGQGDVKLRSYTRGLDLSQTLNETGGIGSLLAMTIHDASIGTVGSYTYGYDGIGNVTVLLDASDTIVAGYTYDPFGKVINSTGALSGANPYQFSTKEYEATWGLNYYLYRFYFAEQGRWLNRDPIEENGGITLYAMVSNNTVNRIDLYGLANFTDCAKDTVTLPTIEGKFKAFGLSVDARLIFSGSKENCQCCDGNNGNFTKSVSGDVRGELRIKKVFGIDEKLGKYASVWAGLRIRGTLYGRGSFTGNATSCNGNMSYQVTVSVGGAIGADVGGELKVTVGWVNFRVGLVGSGTINFTAWVLSADCDKSGCRNLQLQTGSIGGSIGVTAHLLGFSYTRSFGVSDLFNI